MMDLIKSHGIKNVVVKPHKPIEKMKIVGELGVYGVFLG